MHKVLIVDDHAIVRQGMIRILENMKASRFDIDEAGNEAEALNLFRRSEYSLVLLDISLPGRNGLEILKQIKKERQKTAVLIVSMHPEKQYAIRALRSGASGYVSKDHAAGELPTAVVRLLEGGKYISAAVAELLTEQISDTGACDGPLHDQLSDRELQLVCLMAAGKTMTEIAHELCLSIKTVSTYRTRILEKLKLRTSGEIITYALDHKLVIR